MFKDIIFANPLYLYLLLLLIPLIGWYIYKLRKMQASFGLSSTALFQKIAPTWKVYMRHFPFVLRLLALSALIIVLARPQSINSSDISKTEGIDIIVALMIIHLYLAPMKRL